MEVIYGRISTIEQNKERQLEKEIKCFIDICSGAVPFFERPQAKKLIEYLKENPSAITKVVAVDRIGRSTLDILMTVQYFKQKNYTLKIDNLGMDSKSPFFDLLISLLGTLAEHEKQTIKERCIAGIINAKNKGIYIGRKKGTVDNRQKTLNKHSDIVKCLNNKMKINDIVQLTHKTRNTIYKVKRLL